MDPCLFGYSEEMCRSVKMKPGHVRRGRTLDLFLGQLCAFLLGIFILAPQPGRADTVSNCTFQAFKSALNKDQQAIFDEDCQINFTNTILVTNNITIDGTGVNVSLNGSTTTNGFRLFYVKDGGTLNLTGVTLNGGKTNLGGAVYVESGGALIVDSCIFLGNLAVGTNGVAGTKGNNSSGTAGNGTGGKSGGEAMGGAIFNLGDLTVSSSQFFTNAAVGGNGGNGGAGGNGGSRGGNGGAGGSGAVGLGGAIYDAGQNSSITDCTFDG